MNNPRLAGRYAKSLIDLAVERNQLEVVYNDMKYLQAVIKASREFANLLKSPVIPAPLKAKSLTAVTKGNVGELTAAFNSLLISKARETVLPEIVEAFIDLYNDIKGIHKVKLTTAVEIGEDVKTAIKEKISRDTSLKNIELETKVRDEIIGGFILEYNNNLVDGSILRDLKDVKKQFDSNAFIQKIR
jgi:F-type H+-transporting ATPase subunit delta